jgi:hypothetical protein
LASIVLFVKLVSYVAPRQFLKAKSIDPMKNLKSISIILSIILMMATSTRAQKQADGKFLRHVVLLKFKDTAKPADVKKVEVAFAGLSKKIPLIRQFEWGLNNSPENLNQGLTHCFFVTFASEKDRDDYLVHPDHKVFVDILLPHLDKVTVVDYWAKE